MPAAVITKEDILKQIEMGTRVSLLTAYQFSSQHHHEKKIFLILLGCS
jgi:hypothetical protein